MEMTGWILAGLFGLTALFLWRRGRTEPGGPGRAGTTASRTGVVSAEDAAEQATDAALRGVARYLRRAVVAPLEAGLAEEDASGPLEDARDALDDLAFYARRPPEDSRTSENLADVIQEVAREYTRARGVSVRYSGPARPVRARISREAFQDAFYLLLENAGRFGGGQTIEIGVAEEGDELRIRVGDRGSGFGSDALGRAFDPFWTTEPDALGLGLPHARRLLRRQGASIGVRNREAGGGEVSVTLARDS